MSIVSFHLVRYPRSYRATGASFMYFDRATLQGTRGLQFWRLLGTAKGRSMSLSVDPDRWALLGVWDDDAALQQFLRTSPISARWAGEGQEVCTLRLQHIGGHGSWGAGYPFPGTAIRPAPHAPIAVLTRASIRPTRLMRFYRAAPAVDRALARQTGLLQSVGMGEWPVARQATFSVWDGLAAVQAFAYQAQEHQEVIRRTRNEGWFREELFSRFAVVDTEGTWDGVPPLAGHS